MATIDPFPISRGGERSSRFIEPPMYEYTPANSLYDESASSHSGSNGPKTFLRALNAILHLAACALLLAIVAIFLSRSRGFWFKTMS